MNKNRIAPVHGRRGNRGERPGVLEMHASWFADAKRFGEIKPEWFVFPGRKGKAEVRRETAARSYGPNAEHYIVLGKGRLHDLRHTAATKMAAAGVPESTMLAIMGHMSRAMLERYSHIRMAAKREAVKSLSLPDLRKETPVEVGISDESLKAKRTGAPN
jgi:integrase